MNSAENTINVIKFVSGLVPRYLRLWLALLSIAVWLPYLVGVSLLSGAYLMHAFNFFSHYSPLDIANIGMMPIFLAILCLTIVLASIFSATSIMNCFRQKKLRTAQQLLDWLVQSKYLGILILLVTVFVISVLFMHRATNGVICKNGETFEFANGIQETIGEGNISLPMSSSWVMSYDQANGIIDAKRVENFTWRQYPSPRGSNNNDTCLGTIDWVIRLWFQ